MAEPEDIDEFAFLASRLSSSGNNSSSSSNDSTNAFGSLRDENGSGMVFVNMARFMEVYVVPVIVAVGLCGNLLSFMVFVGTHMRRSSSSIYLAGLCLADAVFLVCVFVSWAVSAGVNIYAKEGWCQTFVYLTYVSSFLSVWYVVSFTVERYIAVHFPLRRQELCTTKRAKIVVTSLAGSAAILYSFGAWTSGVIVHFPGMPPVCTPLPHYMAAVSIINNIDTVIMLILPFLAILIMNVRIACKVAKFYRERKQLFLRQNPTSSSGQHANSQASNHRARCTRTQVRVTKMLLLVSSIFLVLNLPRHSVRTYSFIRSLSLEHNTPTLHYLAWENIFRVLYYVHFSINVFLYSKFGKNFRGALFCLGRKIKHVVLRHCGAICPCSEATNTWYAPPPGSRLRPSLYRRYVRYIARNESAQFD